MSVPDSPTTTPAHAPEASLAAAIADVHVAIARAADERELMAALAPLLARRSPARAELCLIACDEHGAPQHIHTVAHASFTDPDLPAPHPSGPLSASPLADVWLAAADQPLELRDLDDDPRVSSADRQALAAYRALTILPLYSPRQRAWQGCIRLLWLDPHSPGLEERFLDRLLMQTVTAAIATRRTVREHAAALAETRALHAAHARLHTAASLDDLLAVVAGISGIADDRPDAAWLARVDPDLTLAPCLEILATVGRVPVTTGSRLELPALALRDRDDDSARFIPDLDHAPDLDPCARQILEALQLRAAAILPLRWRGRFTGIIVLGWSAPHLVSARARRLHLALARQAAVILDSRLLLSTTRDALAEQQRQRATLEALLDHLPVGVLVHAVARDQPTLINRQARRLADDLTSRRLLYPGTDLPMPPSQWPMARALQSGQLVVGEAELYGDDGRRRTIESMAAPVRDDHDQLTHIIAVTTEVTARRRAEAERLAMHEALIRAQDDALAERSTPLLPIADDILVMPIIGTIDAHRGQQIMETLVGLGGQHVRVAIIDLTGAGLDGLGAHALIGAARALRLRGAVPVLTGLDPAAARGLTELGVDLTGVAVCRTLAAGIAHARALIGRRRPPAASQPPVPRDISPPRRRP